MGNGEWGFANWKREIMVSVHTRILISLIQLLF